jgi:predicted nucleic acid-binding protein
LYLVDTNIMSVTAPSRPAQARAAEWLEENTASLFVSVISIAEIEAGIAKARREGAYRKADNLTAWLETVLHLYAPRILPFDLPAARLAGHLADLARGQGQAPGSAGIMIAATAQWHGLTILTRNLRHFLPLGVPAHDPFVDP